MFDIIIKDIDVADGTGKPIFKSDIAIKDGVLSSVEPSLDAPAEEIINGEGLTAAPGFIDMHSHSDMSLFDPKQTEIKLRQGVTAEVIGNCGISVAPVNPEILNDLKDFISSIFGGFYVEADWLGYGDYLRAVYASDCPMRIFGLLGHSTLRIHSMGFSADAPDADQLRTMKRELEDGLEKGAVGLSTGLIYAPGAYAKTEELIELAKVVAQFNGDKFYASHIRNESFNVLPAVDEALRIGREARVPIHISHLKIAGKKNWAMKDALIQKLEKAVSDGMDLTCDLYPYRRTSTTITSLLPPWALEGGTNAMLNRMKNTEHLKKITDEVRYGVNGRKNTSLESGLDNIYIANVTDENRYHMIGKTLEQCAFNENADPVEFFLDLIVREKGAVTITVELMDDRNLTDFFSLPFVMTGSDGLPSGGKPHPRLYGTFPRIIRRFVREKKSLTLEAAVHKMTGMAADRLHKDDMGRLLVGKKADMVLFNAETITDCATYDDPLLFPRGIRSVIIDGKQILNNQEGSD